MVRKEFSAESHNDKTWSMSSLDWPKMWLIFAVLCAVAALVVGTIALYKVENESNSDQTLVTITPTNSSTSDAGTASLSASSIGTPQNVAFNKSFSATPSVVIEAKENLTGQRFDATLVSQSSTGFSFLLDLDLIPDLGTLITHDLDNDAYMEMCVHTNKNTGTVTTLVALQAEANTRNLYALRNGQIVPGNFVVAPQENKAVLGGSVCRFVDVSDIAGLEDYVMFVYRENSTTLHFSLISLASDNLIVGDKSGTRPNDLWTYTKTVNSSNTDFLEVQLTPDQRLAVTTLRTTNVYEVNYTKSPLSINLIKDIDWETTPLSTTIAPPTNIGVGAALRAPLMFFEYESSPVKKWVAALYAVAATTLKVTAWDFQGLVAGVQLFDAVNIVDKEGSAFTTTVARVYKFGNPSSLATQKLALIYTDTAATVRMHAALSVDSTAVKPAMYVPVRFDIKKLKTFPDCVLPGTSPNMDVQNDCLLKSDGSLVSVVRCNTAGKSYMKQYTVSLGTSELVDTLAVTDNGYINHLRPSSVIDSARSYYQKDGHFYLTYNESVLTNNVRVVDSSEETFISSFDVEWIAVQ